MSVSKESKPGGLATLGRTYVADLRGWLLKIAQAMVIAAALFIAASFFILAAVAVGLIALFHLIELRYGTNIAFAAIGGGMFVLALILLFAGWATLHRKGAPFPRPHRQARAARQMLIGSTVSRTFAALGSGNAARPDPVTQLLLGAAAVLVVGWIVSANLASTAPSKKVRR